MLVHPSRNSCLKIPSLSTVFQTKSDTIQLDHLSESDSKLNDAFRPFFTIWKCLLDKKARARAGSPFNDTGAKHSITHSGGLYILVSCIKISILYIPHHTIPLFTSLMCKSGIKY